MNKKTSMHKPERNERICEMYTTGSTPIQIAEELGVSRQRVHQIIVREGVWKPIEEHRKQFAKPKPPKKKWQLTLDKFHPARDGHWTCYSPYVKGSRRGARAMAEWKEKRPLNRSEEAILIDGDPENLTFDNVAVMSRQCAHAFRKTLKQGE